MTKIILLALLVSLNSFAQSTDELTLESTTAPTIVEDGTDLSSAPAEEPVEAPDTVDITETLTPVNDTAPAELAPKAGDEELITDLPEDDAPVAEVNAKEVETPNPTADAEIKPDEQPKVEKVADQVPPASKTTPIITSEIPKDDRFIDHRKSHWVSTYTVEGLKYNLPWNFQGEKKNFGERDQELYGPRIGFGGQLYLGAGFFTTTMIEGYYAGTLFTKIQQAGPQVSGEKVGEIKRVSGLYGGDVSQSLGRIFEFKSKNPFMDEWAYLTFEPFIEAGIGVARSYNRIYYRYDTSIVESYKAKIQDELTNARVGGGFNMTSRGGFFLQVRATVNRFDITKRKSESYARATDGTITSVPSATVKDAKMDPVTIVTIGGGYKF